MPVGPESRTNPTATPASGPNPPSGDGDPSDHGVRSVAPARSDPGPPSDPGTPSDPGPPSDPGTPSDPGSQSGPGAPTTAAAGPSPDSTRGLSTADVAQRVAAGRTNAATSRTSRTVASIVRANVVTRFNGILGVMFVVALAVGGIRDALFGIVLVFNALIGIVQEVRTKRSLDRLAVLNAPQACVRRDGAAQQIPTAEVVLDDVIELRAGDQIAADGLVLEAIGLELDESLLTGESDAIHKDPGDEIRSGSFVVAGSGLMRATGVGDDSYAQRIASDAKEFVLASSDLQSGINTILRYITWAIVVVAPLLLWGQLRSDEGSTKDALIGTVAGVVGMVPEGLVLLTSVAFGLAALTLTRRKVLVRELPAVEGLARVDVVCLDKTGTLTEGEIEYAGMERCDGAIAARWEQVGDALGASADVTGRNATFDAIASAFPAPGGPWVRTGGIAFSSARKWSAATFGELGTWLLGAPEMLVLEGHATVRSRAAELADTGTRTLLLAWSDAAIPPDQPTVPAGAEPVALLRFTEKVREDASDTLAYFASQGVALKVISGDNPRTVAAVAQRVELLGPGVAVTGFDARELPDDIDELADILEREHVFGRVTPQQKRAMVQALQSRGHVVAMTGDGVNDVLALKDADIGVAMGSGAAATRAVAQLVLLDGRFSHMPAVVAEGRRVIANIERVANLFLVKNAYATVLALMVAMFGVTYPFLPRHLTLISSLTIGIPAFFLALGPGAPRYRPGFMRRVLRFAVPVGVAIGVLAAVGYGISRLEGEDVIPSQTTATLIVVSIGLWVVSAQARPFVWWKRLLVMTMAGGFALALLLPYGRDFFALTLPAVYVWGTAAAIALAACVLGELWWRTVQRRKAKAARAHALLAGADTPDAP